MSTERALDRRARADLFRERLRAALRGHGLPAATVARCAGIDRSTLAQLVTAEPPRLPNGQALAMLASTLGVTTDWLLGLVDDPAPVASLIDASVQITDVPFAPADQNLLRWLDEASGHKIRHVPLSLPALLKTEAVLRYEYQSATARTSDQAIADSERRLTYARDASTDFEICCARQIVEGFARGEGIWGGLGASDRIAQLERMAEVLGELYPRVRLHLFDAKRMHAVPLTVFGPQRAVVYAGQSYLVFNARRHVQVLATQFDALIRAAAVHAHETSAFAETCRHRVR